MAILALDHGGLAYDEQGAGPALLLLHAGVADRRMWDAQVAHFAGAMRVVRFDMRGFGDSALPDGSFSYAADVLALADRLDLGRFWCMAASFGAQVAVDFALEHSQRLAGLVLITPVVGGVEHSADVVAFGQQEGTLLEAGRLEDATELNMRMWVDGPQRASADVDPALRRRVAEMQLRAFSQPQPEHASVVPLEPPAIGRLEELAMPVLVVAGELDVPSFVQLAQTIAQRIAGAELVVVPGAAHMLAMEAPQRLNQAASQFIRSHAGR
jgi:pimeloyl-ACP methyl ester carboxylesterase